MNNLVFNTVAEELKTTIYAEGPGNIVKSLKLDSSDNLLVSMADGTVEISNASLTVAGTVTVSEITAPVTVSEITAPVTVSEITAPVTIGNSSLTVAGTVTVSEITASVTVSEITAPVTVSEITAPVTIGNSSLTVAGTVTVSEITAPVTVSEITAPVTIGANSFTSSSVISTSVTGTGVILPDTDISTLKVGSIFIYNEGATPITISLQISPTTDEANYMNDPFYTDKVIDGNESFYMAVSNFANYIRLQYNLGAETATFSTYFNGQA